MGAATMERPKTEKVEKLEGEAGEAVGEMPPAADPGDGDNDVAPEEIRVKGPHQLSMFDVGGKKAQTGSLRLTGGRVLLVDGQCFKKGEVIRFEGTAVVEEVGQRDKADTKTGQVVSCEQKHAARITDLLVAP